MCSLMSFEHYIYFILSNTLLLFTCLYRQGDARLHTVISQNNPLMSAIADVSFGNAPGKIVC